MTAIIVPNAYEVRSGRNVIAEPSSAEIRTVHQLVLTQKEVKGQQCQTRCKQNIMLEALAEVHVCNDSS